jgi:ABC-2 type transport system ATP-binding protein
VFIQGLEYRAQAVEIRRNLGVLPEELGLFEALTVFENLRAIGPIYGLTKRETETRATSLLQLLNLTQGQHTLARECSFGMRKKTALAMALLYNPDVLLLDEPFEGIDHASSSTIQKLLRQLASDGATILLTSHIFSIVQNTATRVIILRAGRVESDFDPLAIEETVEDIYSRIVPNPQLEVPDWLRS